MFGLIIVSLLGLSLAGFLIGLVVVMNKKQANQMASRIAQADVMAAKDHHWGEVRKLPTPLVVSEPT